MQSLHPSQIGLIIEVEIVVNFSERLELKVILVKKFYEAGALKETILYPTRTFVRVENSSGTYDYTYVKHEGQLVAQLNPDGTKYFVHGDHEGSTSVITDTSGRMLENTTYTPYGEILSGGAVSRFDSEGKEYSSYVGDYDFNFRKMKPEWGLFTQPDTLIPNIYDPQSLNRYAFEKNNPYRYVDPDGHFLVDLIETINRYLAVKIYGEEVKTVNQDKEYARLYTEYRQQNPNLNLPENAFQDTLRTGGGSKTVRVSERRMSLEELRTWKESASPTVSIAPRVEQSSPQKTSLPATPGSSRDGSSSGSSLWGKILSWLTGGGSSSSGPSTSGTGKTTDSGDSQGSGSPSSSPPPSKPPSRPKWWCLWCRR